MQAILVVLFYIVAMSPMGVIEAKQKCYVCIPNIGATITDVINLYPSGPSLPLCSRFQVNSQEYIRECPRDSFVGCMTQTNGTHVTKTCSDRAIQDCKTANGIEYCYCRGDLCNNGGVPVEAARPAVVRVGDDEDMSEGSGTSTSSIEVNENSKQVEQEQDEQDIVIDVTTTLTTTSTTTSTSTVHQLSSNSLVHRLDVSYVLIVLIGLVTV